MNRAAAIAMAREEVTTRKSVLTQTFLRGHQLDLSDPVVLPCSATDGEYQVCVVHFRIKGQRYTFVVSISARGEDLVVDGVALQPDVQVYLKIETEMFSADVIAAELGLTPADRGSIVPLFPQRRGREPMVRGWRYEPQRDLPGGLEEKLTLLLERLERRRDSLAGLSARCTMRIVIVVTAWSGNPQFAGWVLEPPLLSALARVGLEADFALYGAGA